MLKNRSGRVVVAPLPLGPPRRDRHVSPTSGHEPWAWIGSLRTRSTSRSSRDPWPRTATSATPPSPSTHPSRRARSKGRTHLTADAPGQRPNAGMPTTIAGILEGAQPMGDLSRFAIDDLTPEEEDEFFRILEEA